jgi:hypothetical protein
MRFGKRQVTYICYNTLKVTLPLFFVIDTLIMWNLKKAQSPKKEYVQPHEVVKDLLVACNEQIGWSFIESILPILKLRMASLQSI